MPTLFVDIMTITALPQINYFKNCVIGIFKKFNKWFKQNYKILHCIISHLQKSMIFLFS